MLTLLNLMFSLEPKLVNVIWGLSMDHRVNHVLVRGVRFIIH